MNFQDFSRSAIALLSILLVGCGGKPAARQQGPSATPPAAEPDIASLRKQADAGNPEAQFKLGVMHDQGARGVLQDYELAASLNRKSAEQGYAPAQYSLGQRYLSGRGAPQDDAQVVAWFRKAGDQGLLAAQYDLGVIYHSGRGVPQDDAEALIWFRKAAGQGHAKAQYYLGEGYFSGRGVAHDDAQAAVWFRRAADQANAQAQHALGVMCQKGRGVPQDYEQAFRWFNLAAAFAFGDPALGALSMREAREVEKFLTPQQIADAETFEREWIAAFERRTK